MEDGGLFVIARHTVFAQFGQQRIYLLIGLLDVGRLPHGHNDASQRLRILPRGGEAVLIVAGIGCIQCALPLGGIFDELDDSVFLVVLCVQFRVDGGHALCGGGDLRFEGSVLLFGLIQRIRELALPGIGVFQLLVRSFQRTLVLRDGFLLQRQFLLQGGKLRLRALDGFLKVVHARGGALEFALRLLYLFVDGREIAREIVPVQRKRHHKVAQDFAHLVAFVS